MVGIFTADKVGYFMTIALALFSGG
jgi:hypothetical protein